MKRFSVAERQAALQELPEQEWDLFVIGGGINGAGVARDAAMRGMRVALVEASDFAWGTSSRSSKLVHGGIRYLENYEFHLVFEALSERRKLLEMAPHMVHPLRFLLPIFKGGRVPYRLLALGMWAYDLLALFESPEFHEALDAQGTLESFPALRSQELDGGFLYSDALMDDDRLVYETLRSAHDHGMVAANGVRALGADFSGRDLKRVTCRDEKTGREFIVKARHVVSCVGAWSDLVLPHLQRSWQPKMRPTKGVHLTFSRERFPLQHAVVMAAEDRIVFAIPRPEMVIVGTTDTDFTGDPAAVSTTRQDVDYLMGVVSHYFPQLKLEEKDIISSYAGVRPLVRDEAGSTGKTSREHTIISDSSGLTIIMGGKYTTYRQIAQDVLDSALTHFPLGDRVKWSVCSTEAPLNPQITRETYAWSLIQGADLAAEAEVSESVAHQLLLRHGPEAFEIVRREGPGKSWLEYEAGQAIEATMCWSLSEFFMRRVPVFLCQVDHGLAEVEAVAKVFQQRLSWSDTETQTQIEGYRKSLAHELAWKRG